MTERVKFYGEWLFCGQPRGRAIMAEWCRRKTRSGEKDEDDIRARLMNRARRMNMKMRRNNLNSALDRLDQDLVISPT